MLSLERFRDHILAAFASWKPPRRSREQVEDERTQHSRRYVEASQEMCSLMRKGREIDWARVRVLERYRLSLQPQMRALDRELYDIREEESKAKATAAAIAKKRS